MLAKRNAPAPDYRKCAVKLQKHMGKGGSLHAISGEMLNKSVRIEPVEMHSL